MSARRRITPVVAVLVAAAAAALAAPTPASADGRAPNSCDDRPELCFYVNANFNDGPGRVTNSQPNLAVFPHDSCRQSGRTWNNCISSLWNNTNRCWHLHDATSYRNGFHNLGPNDGYTNLARNTTYNDKISSLRKGPTGNCYF